ncbi:MAG: ORF6N domain-containing protein [Oceanipulchritudo sp.]
MKAFNLPVYTLRSMPIVLDSDLAKIYEVETKVFNQAFKRNAKRFPPEFAFQLTDDEWLALRSQIVTLKSPGRGRHRKYLPWVFTEHGALMASTILNSDEAVSMSVYVIRAFVKMRENLMANAIILKRLAEIDKTLMRHDQALWDIYQKLLPLLQPPEVKPKRRLGFHTDEE